MENVRIDKSDLLKIIQENRAKHREVFEEAIEGYRKMAVAELERSIAAAKAGQQFARMLSLPEPVDQTKEYDRAIRMLSLSLDSAIVLDEQTFANLVMDEWHWTKHWTGSNSLYVNTHKNREYLDSKMPECRGHEAFEITAEEAAEHADAEDVDAASVPRPTL
jgi:hypothetical protein